MREIKFRGYSKGIEKWIYGCLLKCWSKVKQGFIDDKPMIVSQNNNTYFEVVEMADNATARINTTYNREKAKLFT